MIECWRLGLGAGRAMRWWASGGLGSETLKGTKRRRGRVNFLNIAVTPLLFSAWARSMASRKAGASSSWQYRSWLADAEVGFLLVVAHHAPDIGQQLGCVVYDPIFDRVLDATHADNLIFIRQLDCAGAVEAADVGQRIFGQNNQIGQFARFNRA